MEFAFLILAHNNPKGLYEFIDSIYEPNSLIYIHIDRKSDIQVFETVLKPFISRIRFVKCRIDVNWGGFSMVEATLELIKNYLESNVKADYIHLCSGSDRLLKSFLHFVHFFEENQGHNFMEYFSLPYAGWPNNGYDRFYYEWYIDQLGSELSNKLVDIKRLKGYTRTIPIGYTLYGGSQWWSLTHECIEYIFYNSNCQSKLYNFFHNVYIPDESYFHTLILNSTFSSSVVNDNQRYIDWFSGPTYPRVLNEVDRSKWEASGKLLGRKFHESVLK